MQGFVCVTVQRRLKKFSLFQVLIYIIDRAGPGVSPASPWARATPHHTATNWEKQFCRERRSVVQSHGYINSIFFFCCFFISLFPFTTVYALLNKTRKEEEMPFLNFVGTTFYYPLIFLHVYISYPSMNLRLLGPNWPSTYNGLEASGPPNPIQIHMQSGSASFVSCFIVQNDAGALTTKLFFFDKHLTTKLL